MAVLAFLVLSAFRMQAWQWTPPHLTTWADFGVSVSNAYSTLTNTAWIYPPGPWHFGIGEGHI